jgi:hypothetical protein
MIDFDNLDDKRLEQIRRSIENTELMIAGPEFVALVEKHWPWLLGKLHRLQ